MTQVKAMLKALGLRQRDLVKALNVGDEEISRWLNGVYMPSAPRTAQILRFLNQPEHLERLGRNEPIRFEDLFEVAT